VVAFFAKKTKGRPMINPDEIDPPRPVMKPKDLQPLSIGELRDYIVGLRAEIERAEAMIAQKESHKNNVAGLFSLPAEE
jgi:uncharacterized small protein (DUF1192 family)